MNNTNLIKQCKYNLVLCEQFNKETHGFDNDSDPNVVHHHLVMYSEKDVFSLKKTMKRMKKYMQLRHGNRSILPYEQLQKPEIAECIYLRGGECVAIIKTFWLKIVQRKWRLICKQRKIIINKRSQPQNIYYNQVYGKWPTDCRVFPSLNGMMT
jgi:hypothetical protein